MVPKEYEAFLVSETADHRFHQSVVKRPVEHLPPGDILIRVRYSSLNYKDALSAAGNKGVTKVYPHVPGIDASGTVEESTSPAFRPGDEVLVTGYELGANLDGGFAEYVRVPADWVVLKPPGLTLRECMIYGTAGLTAGLAVYQLCRHGLEPDAGSVLVTGATGGVGCLSIAILARAGFHPVAATGKLGERDFLMGLGAREVISRDEALDTTGRGLVAGRWAGAVDTVGGPILDSTIRQTKFFGPVAVCGNVTSGDLHTSIYPFILRGVSLLGINSAFTPMPLRLEIWHRLATDWKPGMLDSIAQEVTLSGVNAEIESMLRGEIKGRIVVRSGR